MKKFYILLLTVALFIPGVLLAQSGGNKDILGGPNFDNDIIITAGDTMNQRNVVIASAFNGWLYSAYTITNSANTRGGIVIKYSKDNGFTWKLMDWYFVPGALYDDVEIEVCGTDTNNLNVFVAGVRRFLAGPDYVAFIDNYDGRNGTFLGARFNRGTGTRRIYDLSLASDYEFPGVSTSPYSVGLLVSEYTPSQDSLLFFGSMDGGQTFTVKAVVATTGGYFRKHSLSYGRSTSGSNGRYFAAWEQRSSSTARVGHIYTSRSQSQVNSTTWINPICLDSISNTMINLCRDPRIATQYNDADNDSGSLTAVVLVARDYNGDASDYDLLGFFNKRAHFTPYWYRLDVLNTGENDMQPDIVYSTQQSTFYASYMDSTHHKLTYISNTMNLATPNNWQFISYRYNDDTTVTRNAYPRLAYNPAGPGTAAVWVDEGPGGFGIAKYDADYLGVYVGTPEEDPITFSVNAYPNPTSDVLNLSIQLQETAQVQCTIMDLSGRLVYQSTPVEQYAGTSVYPINVSGLASGQYIIRLNVGGEEYSQKMQVVR